MKNKALFLDRDGVINKRPPQGDYVKKWDELEFNPGIEKLIAWANKNNYLVIVITNQRGVGRKLMSKKDLEMVHTKIVLELQKKGAKITKVFSCIHNEEDNCDCRKPKPGLLFQAAKEFDIDLSKSLMIGDQQTDIQAAQSAGCSSLLIEPNSRILISTVSEIIKNR